MNIIEIDQLDVYSEEFSKVFLTVLTKFVTDNDDMAIMGIHQKASALLNAINDL